jgi:hypothetical protein
VCAGAGNREAKRGPTCESPNARGCSYHLRICLVAGQASTRAAKRRGRLTVRCFKGPSEIRRGPESPAGRNVEDANARESRIGQVTATAIKALRAYRLPNTAAGRFK